MLVEKVLAAFSRDRRGWQLAGMNYEMRSLGMQVSYSCGRFALFLLLVAFHAGVGFCFTQLIAVLMVFYVSICLLTFHFLYDIYY